MEAIYDILKDYGADLIMMIPTPSIRLGAWTIMKCKYGCPNYGRNLTCPPFSPSYTYMRDMLGDYRRAILFRIHDMQKGTPAAIAAAAALFRSGYYRAVPFGTGPCTKCDKCCATVGGCPEPWNTAPSMEACGIDVFGTVRANGIEVNTYSPAGSQPDCFGLILVD